MPHQECQVHCWTFDAGLKPATESLQGKQVDLGCCMTTITLMKQQLQEMNVDYWHNFLFPKIIKLGEELNVDIAKPRQAGGGNQPESVSEYYGKVWRSALQNYRRPQSKV